MPARAPSPGPPPGGSCAVVAPHLLSATGGRGTPAPSSPMVPKIEHGRLHTWQQRHANIVKREHNPRPASPPKRKTMPAQIGHPYGRSHGFRPDKAGRTWDRDGRQGRRTTQPAEGEGKAKHQAESPRGRMGQCQSVYAHPKWPVASPRSA